MSNKGTKTMNDKQKLKRGLKPRLRFPEFQDAGEWEDTLLGKVAEVLQGYGFPERYQGKKEGRYPFYKVSDISNSSQKDECYIYEAANYIDQDILDELRAKPVPAGTTILARIGEAIRLNRRAITSTACVIDNNVVGIKKIEGRASDKFVYYLLSRINLADYGGGVVPAVNKSAIENIPIARPEIPEQETVENCLYSLDELITAEARKLDALKAHRKGLMQHLFPAEGESVPRLRFPEFVNEGEWGKKNIDDVLIEVSRPVEMKDEDEYSLVIVKRRYEGIISRGRILGKAIKVKSQFTLEKDDFLISKRQIVHCACGLVSGQFEGSIVSNEYSILRARNGLNIRFFNYFCQQPSVRKSFLECSIGIVIEKMLFRLEDWMKRKFFFPTIREQQKIADCLTSVDELITARSRRIDALKAHKTGLMQQLFPVTNEVEG